MKNKKSIVIVADLNVAVNFATEVRLNALMSYDLKTSYGEVKQTVKLFPRGIEIVNGTGADLLYNYIANEEEYQEYLDNQTNFDMILFPNGETLKSFSLYSCKYLILRKVAAEVVANDLIVNFLNYQNR